MLTAGLRLCGIIYCNVASSLDDPQQIPTASYQILISRYYPLMNPPQDPKCPASDVLDNITGSQVLHRTLAQSQAKRCKAACTNQLSFAHGIMVMMTCTAET